MICDKGCGPIKYCWIDANHIHADFASDDSKLAELRAEKFDFALAHHLDLCPVSVIHALGVSNLSAK